MGPVELAILKAQRAVEEMPADVRLTEAVDLLRRARVKVADFVNGVAMTTPSTPAWCEVVAAFEAMANESSGVASCCRSRNPDFGDGYMAAVDRYKARIRALTPVDAKVALDAMFMKAEERGRASERALYDGHIVEARAEGKAAGHAAGFREGVEALEAFAADWFDSKYPLRIALAPEFFRAASAHLRALAPMTPDEGKRNEPTMCGRAIGGGSCACFNGERCACSCHESISVTEGEGFARYRRTQFVEMRPYVVGETLSDCISISATDRTAGSPMHGDMIARNPANHEDQWLVAADYFAMNFRPMVCEDAPVPKEGEDAT